MLKRIVEGVIVVSIAIPVSIIGMSVAGRLMNLDYEKIIKENS